MMKIKHEQLAEYDSGKGFLNEDHSRTYEGIEQIE